MSTFVTAALEGVKPSMVSARLRADRFRVPGTLSGPRRLGALSYSHAFARRTQLLQDGRVLSQRILRARHCLHAMTALDAAGRVTLLDDDDVGGLSDKSLSRLTVKDDEGEGTGAAAGTGTTAG